VVKALRRHAQGTPPQLVVNLVYRRHQGVLPGALIATAEVEDGLRGQPQGKANIS